RCSEWRRRPGWTRLLVLTNRVALPLAGLSVGDTHRASLRSIAVLLACTAYASVTVAQSDSPTPPQVTIDAQRKAIEPRVRAFVNEYLHVESEEGPARWRSPVCPTVLGLSRDDGEFILARLSQIAREAGVPL